MSDASSYSLRNGIFSTCSGRWIPEENRYRNANVSEIAECCLKQCTEPVEYCEKYCIDNSGPGKIYDTQKKVDDCLATCSTYRNLCNDICQLSSPYFNEASYYLDCAGEKGCLDANRQTNSACIKANSDEILSCCLERCIPTEDLDCDKYCAFSHNIAINKNNLLRNKVNAPKITKSKSNGTFYTIITGILIGIVVLFLIRKLSKK
jgi:hypothetical protein